MISVMVGDQKYLSQICAPLTVRDLRREIHRSVPNQSFQLFQVREKPINRSLPHFICHLVRTSWPISVGPFWRRPRRVERVPQDILLSYSHMLELFPDRMPILVRTYASELSTDVGQRVFRLNVSL